ncbi:MAG: SGNH/GDSL hydrolase family protein [Clostridia bacterium]|nr:SGNH/GDSL hydrolase family protein [Clostridia bacterium]
MDLSVYQRDAFAFPFWKNDLMLHESFWPVGSGEMEVPLLFKADEILSVRSSDLLTEYQEGRDYFLRDGRLYLTADTTIEVTPPEGYASPEPIANQFSATGFACRTGGYLFFAESSAIIKKQFMVTYRHSEGWNGPTPPDIREKLPKTMALLRSATPFTVGYWGDSITTGCNASSLYGLAPNVEMWPIMTTEMLSSLYGVNLDYINKAVGGTSTPWGVSEFDKAFGDNHPDLLFVAFGMNDASGKRSPAEYAANTRRIIELAREKTPDCEIVLIATTLPNPDAVGFEGPHAEYEPELLKIAEEYEGVATLPLTSFHAALLEKKNFRDMTGNNINHPNDFLTRIYTQYILASFYSF